MTRLILVTGSRTWDDPTPIARLLQAAFDPAGRGIARCVTGSRSARRLVTAVTR